MARTDKEVHVYQHRHGEEQQVERHSQSGHAIMSLSMVSSRWRFKAPPAKCNGIMNKQPLHPRFKILHVRRDPSRLEVLGLEISQLGLPSTTTTVHRTDLILLFNSPALVQSTPCIAPRQITTRMPHSEHD